MPERLPPLAAYKDLCIDAVDPVVVLGTFWSQVLRLELQVQEGGDVFLTGASPAVMADPEGGEFCAFVREGEITRRIYEVVVDTQESPTVGDAPHGEGPHRIALWWAHVLGATVQDDPRGWSWVEAVPGAPFESMDFVPVPEPKTVKNRLHVDVTTSDVQPLLDAGATLLRAQDSEIGWSVLADPDGNEFCAFTL